MKECLDEAVETHTVFPMKWGDQWVVGFTGNEVWYETRIHENESTGRTEPTKPPRARPQAAGRKGVRRSNTELTGETRTVHDGLAEVRNRSAVTGRSRFLASIEANRRRERATYAHRAATTALSEPDFLSEQTSYRNYGHHYPISVNRSVLPKYPE